MAIDFYDINDKKLGNKLFGIGSNELSEIEEALQKLKNVSGVVIDPYGDTKLYRDHVQLLARFIQDLLDKPGVNKDLLTRLYKNLSSVNEAFLAVGD